MRTQKEILKKLETFAKFITSKKNPAYVQYRILIHKLTWTNAKPYIVPRDRNEKFKAKWNESSRLDENHLLVEIKEQVDIAAMCVQDRDPAKTLGCALILLAQIWLLGDKRDEDLKVFWSIYLRACSPSNSYEPLFSAICTVFEFPWEKFESRYQDINNSRVVRPPGLFL